MPRSAFGIPSCQTPSTTSSPVAGHEGVVGEHESCAVSVGDEALLASCESGDPPVFAELRSTSEFTSGQTPSSSVTTKAAAAVAGHSSTQSSAVRVVVRFRPAVCLQEHMSEPAFVPGGGSPGSVDSADLVHRFHFDRVFDHATSQQDVYDDVGKPVVDGVLDGVHGTIMAYGQTGGGKTHCMFGPDGGKMSEMQGVVPRAVQRIFDSLESRGLADMSVECSFFEVYCDQVRDLLRQVQQGRSRSLGPMWKRGVNSARSSLRETSAGRMRCVEGMTVEAVSSAAETLHLLRSGLRQRAAANTRLNQSSSRSHAIFVLEVRQRASDGSERVGKLTLVDLAGSEKVRKSGSEGDMLTEAKKINSSLSALGHVIDALADRRPHVPYRDSRLTRLLEDSLGGNCRTTLLVACSPAQIHAVETLSSLRFAARAKKVFNVASVNLRSTSPGGGCMSDRHLLLRISHLRRELTSAQQELERRFVETTGCKAASMMPRRGGALEASPTPGAAKATASCRRSGILSASILQGGGATTTAGQAPGKIAIAAGVAKASRDGDIGGERERCGRHAMSLPGVRSRSRSKNAGEQLSDVASTLAEEVLVSAGHCAASCAGSVVAEAEGSAMSSVSGSVELGSAFSKSAAASEALSKAGEPPLGSRSVVSTVAESSCSRSAAGSVAMLPTSAEGSSSATPSLSWRDPCEDVSAEPGGGEPHARRKFSWLIEATPLCSNSAAAAVGSTAIAASVTPPTARQHPSPGASCSENPEGSEEDMKSLRYRLQLEQSRCALLKHELQRRTYEGRVLQQRLEVAEAHLSPVRTPRSGSRSRRNSDATATSSVPAGGAGPAVGDPATWMAQLPSSSVLAFGTPVPEKQPPPLASVAAVPAFQRQESPGLLAGQLSAPVPSFQLTPRGITAQSVASYPPAASSYRRQESIHRQPSAVERRVSGSVSPVHVRAVTTSSPSIPPYVPCMINTGTPQKLPQAWHPEPNWSPGPHRNASPRIASPTFGLQMHAFSRSPSAPLSGFAPHTPR
eukprot:TRINITY_DN101081_c0_g1_i1.p1 TRINITY_DN101081_c0_g1~~TRINITY_DN101081_c0_g1_i1.p1  ORF type:complete len:1023 (-),score=178.92 TRINITY_DN101081_c0_g1_i1:141-3209(-)